MNRILKLAFAAWLGAASFASAGSIEIKLVDPDSFRDFSVSGMRANRSAPIFEREVTRELERLVAKTIGDGNRLVLEFSDIDMAGEIQPWRSSEGRNIRYMESHYPPRLSFAFEVLDAAGEVLLKGSEELRDPTYLSRMRIGAADSFRFEVELLRDWIRWKPNDLVE